MKIAYKASNIIEAHIVAGMLKSCGLESYVGGHYLQGGIGDISAMDFANVFVNDDDIDLAAALIIDYEHTKTD